MRKRFNYLAIILLLLSINLVLAQKIDIETNNEFNPGELLDFTIIVYDENNNPGNDNVEYIIQNDFGIYSNGFVNSGESVSLKLPLDATPGQWKITAKDLDIEFSRIININELQHANIEIIGDELIITNTGNTIYDKSILITIGDEPLSAYVILDIGETKNILLTAPRGEYTVKVNDYGNNDNLVFDNVLLTGNVIGLKKGSNLSFFQKYPLVVIFLIIIFALAILVSYKRYVITKFNY